MTDELLFYGVECVRLCDQRIPTVTAVIDDLASATLERSAGERDVLFLIDRRGEPLVLVSWNAWQWLADTRVT